MPFSSVAGKKWIREQFESMENIRRVLDVGVGCGTYSDLFRKQSRNATWTGIEVFEPYVRKFHLMDKYDHLIIADARKIDFETLGVFDVAFCGDVLEHMTLGEARHMLNRIRARSAAVFLSVPLGACPQGPVCDNIYEMHVAEFPSIGFLHAQFDGIYRWNVDRDQEYEIASALILEC